MKNNVMRMQHEALSTIRQEVSDDDFRYLINYVWFGFDDLTHDGYSVVDYESDISEAINEWGDVLQHSDLDELRAVVKDHDILTIEGQCDDSNKSMDYMKELAEAVDYLYLHYGPFYCRFGDQENELDITVLNDESEVTYFINWEE